jgi:hypothetical protein
MFPAAMLLLFQQALASFLVVHKEAAIYCPFVKGKIDLTYTEYCNRKFIAVLWFKCFLWVVSLI